RRGPRACMEPSGRYRCNAQAHPAHPSLSRLSLASTATKFICCFIGRATITPSSRCRKSKAFTTAKARETGSWARELLGGNGILADYSVARFFADAEALYSYEGTYQMQHLIVGKAVTGFSAFGAERTQCAHLEGFAHGLRGCAGRRGGARRHPHRRGR